MTVKMKGEEAPVHRKITCIVNLPARKCSLSSRTSVINITQSRLIKTVATSATKIRDSVTLMPEVHEFIRPSKILVSRLDNASDCINVYGKGKK